MRKNFLRSLVVVAAIALLIAPLATLSRVVRAGGFSPSLSISSPAISSYNTATDETTNTGDYGPLVGDDGYVGTFSWDYSTSSGTGSVTAYLLYQVYYYDTTTDAWGIYDADYVAIDVYGASASGTGYADFFAGSGIPDGAYTLNAWICDGTSTSITTVLDGVNGDYVFAFFDNDPMPDPEPSPGPYPGDPPISHPELPPTGPIGPGTSS